MQLTTLEKSTIEKSLIYLIIFAVVVVFGFIFYLFFSAFSKNITLTSPVGGEKWEIGQTYKIEWKANGISSVGIVLFKGKEATWIKKNIPAVLGKYEWTIEPGQAYGDDYWISVFEYPYRKDSKIAYSDGAFVITYPELANCDNLMVDSGGTFLPGDYPNIRKMFLTEKAYSGNLGGFEGADKICAEEAKSLGLTTTYHAFLGGDSDDLVATERIKSTPRRDQGVFVEAKPEVSLIRGVGCHRLVGKNFGELITVFKKYFVLNKEKIDDAFLKGLKDVWLGRIDSQAKLNCVPIASVVNDAYTASQEKYSYTTTCQNWTTETKFATGYTTPQDLKSGSFPNCYSASGQSTRAVVMGALSLGTTGTGLNEMYTPYLGKYCKDPQKLLCIEE